MDSAIYRRVARRLLSAALHGLVYAALLYGVAALLGWWPPGGHRIGWVATAWIAFSCGYWRGREDGEEA